MFHNGLRSLFQKHQFLQRIIHHALFSKNNMFYNELCYIFTNTSVFTINFTILKPFWHRAGPVAEQSRAGPSRAEPSRAGPGRAEPRRAEPSQAKPSRAEPSRSEPTPCRAEPSRAGPGICMCGKKIYPLSIANVFFEKSWLRMASFCDYVGPDRSPRAIFLPPSKCFFWAILWCHH